MYYIGQSHLSHIYEAYREDKVNVPESQTYDSVSSSSNLPILKATQYWTFLPCTIDPKVAWFMANYTIRDLDPCCGGEEGEYCSVLQRGKFEYEYTSRSSYLESGTFAPCPL